MHTKLIFLTVAITTFSIQASLHLINKTSNAATVRTLPNTAEKLEGIHFNILGAMKLTPNFAFINLPAQKGILLPEVHAGDTFTIFCRGSGNFELVNNEDEEIEVATNNETFEGIGFNPAEMTALLGDDIVITMPAATRLLFAMNTDDTLELEF